MFRDFTAKGGWGVGGDGSRAEVVMGNPKNNKQTERTSIARNSFCFPTFSFKLMNKQKSVNSEHLRLASLGKENRRGRTRPVLKATSS